MSAQCQFQILDRQGLAAMEHGVHHVPVPVGRFGPCIEHVSAELQDTLR